MQPPTNKKSAKVRPWLISTLFFTVLIAIGFGAALANQRAITDYLALRDYQAPTRIERLATQDSMTDEARRIFYVNKPQILDREPFLRECPSGTAEKTIVLGCYKSDQQGIYVLNVNDPRLDGVKRVTAAHEMLHAVYDRLSTKERTEVDRQLMAFYRSGLTDERIKKTIDAYKKSEPNDVVNEMHSIFATEVPTLPQGLEDYYKKYFIKRSIVTDFSARYQNEFTSRKKQVADYDAQLKDLKTKIDASESDLKARQAEISSRQANLVELRNSNSVSAYNAGVPAYNALIVQYNSQVEQVRGLVNTYNTLVTTRNNVALEEDQLVKGLSADTQTINN